MNGRKTRVYQVLGLRTGGDCPGAWAKIKARTDSTSPIATETGHLDFRVPWLLEGLIRSVDYVSWETIDMEMACWPEATPREDAAWAFRHGRIQGRVDAATDGLSQLRGHGMSAETWSRRWNLKWPGSELLSRDALAAVEIAWCGWEDMRYDLTGSGVPVTA